MSFEHYHVSIQMQLENVDRIINSTMNFLQVFFKVFLFGVSDFYQCALHSGERKRLFGEKCSR